MTAATAPFQLTAEQSEAVGEIIDFDKPWRMGAEVFTGARTSKDRDMVEEVSKILELHGHPTPREWTNDSLIELAKNMPPEGQIFHINRHWRLALAEMEYDTMFIRRALMDTVGSYSDYLRLFDKAVAPYLIPAPSTNAENVEEAAAPDDAYKWFLDAIADSRQTPQDMKVVDQAEITPFMITESKADSPSNDLVTKVASDFLNKLDPDTYVPDLKLVETADGEHKMVLEIKPGLLTGPEKVGQDSVEGA